jgi:acyl carrier protein
VVKVTESNGNKKLCAYVVSDSELTVTQLREYLSRDLPRQMIPDYFLRLEQIPLKPNRKVDLKALDVIGRQLGTGVEYLEPGNEIEEILAGIWTGVLGLSRVSVNDSFFEIGGNSLSIVTVSSRLKQALGRDIALVDLFRFPTIRSLAQFLDLSAAHSGEEVPAPVEERVEVERRGLDKLQNLKKRARELS